jgi:hypothetical protein
MTESAAELHQFAKRADAQTPGNPKRHHWTTRSALRDEGRLHIANSKDHDALWLARRLLDDLVGTAQQ